VLAYVGGQKISWRITIDHYSLLTQTTDGAITLINHFQFGKGIVF